MAPCILTIYPRKAATRVGLFEGRDEIRRSEIRHDIAELSEFPRIVDQWSHRLRAVEDLLGEWHAAPGEMAIDAVIGPAGVPGMAHGGVLPVDRAIIQKMRKGPETEHSTDVSAALVDALARRRDTRAFVVTALSSDEFDPISKLTGIPGLSFGRMLHTFNIKDIAHSAADDLGIPFHSLSLVVAHLGKSFSICSIKDGRVLDLCNANERGPFSPARCGGVPAAEVVRMAYSGEWSMFDLLEKVGASGGMQSYTGTDNLIAVAKQAVCGDAYAGLIFRSMAYQAAQEIAAQATVLKGKVDAIILTGGCAKDDVFVDLVKEWIGWVTERILVYPGEDELRAMAASALRVLSDRGDGAEMASS